MLTGSCIFNICKEHDWALCHSHQGIILPILPQMLLIRPAFNSSPSSAAYVRQWTGSILVLSHYLNWCWFIVNWTPGKNIQWNSNRNSIIFLSEKCIWYCRLPKLRPFWPGGDELKCLSRLTIDVCDWLTVWLVVTMSIAVITGVATLELFLTNLLTPF